MLLVQLAVSMLKMQIDPFLSPCTKLKSKWIQDLHIKPDTLKVIEQKVKSLKPMGTGGKFLNRTLRSTINNLEFIKFKTSVR